jgi:hypothetical protein
MRRRIILAAVLIGGCLEAGLNQNQQAPGNGETGVDVGIGDIAIDPGGRYVFYTSGDRLQYADLVTRTHHRVKGLVDAQRFAFGPAGAVSSTPSAGRRPVKLSSSSPTTSARAAPSGRGRWRSASPSRATGSRCCRGSSRPPTAARWW